MPLIVPILIGLISIILPGFFLALALLKKTNLPLFEIVAIGFIFGMIFPPTMIWLESYLIPLSPIFAFSTGLYNANIVILTIVGILLSVQQGAFSSLLPRAFPKNMSLIKKGMEKDYKKRIASLRDRMSELGTDIKVIKDHQKEEQALMERHRDELALLENAGPEEKRKIMEAHADQERQLFERHEAEEQQLIASTSGGAPKPGINVVWLALLVIMVLTFATRMLSIGIAPRYFEFDPYFDMISAQYILTYGFQLLTEHAAWPTLLNGTIHRIQPIVPYLEAYWYNLAGSNPAASTVNTTLLSNVSSWYPPLTAALLVFVVFMFLYHEYGEFVALIGAGLAAVMPVLLTTFIAGEQLLEPWGIFALIFFYSSYLLAVNNPKELRFAVLAGIAFSSNFLGAHYYTVPAGILSLYIVLQGLIHVFRDENTKDFFRMNLVLIGIAALFYVLYGPYGATLASRTPNILGVPVIVSFPLAALLFVVLFEYVPKLAKKRNMINAVNRTLYIEWLVALIILSIMAILFTPLGRPFQSYLALSVKFTTPSSPLFMTVQEYAPTGPNYNFGAGGFGIIGESIGGISIIVWAVLIAFSVLEILAIYQRNSKSSILAIAGIWPLAIAGMIEVKYLPHFGVAYIIAIGIILGELGLYFSKGGVSNSKAKRYLAIAGVAILAIEALPVLFQLVTAASNPSCAAISQAGNQLGAVLYCNVVPNYWISATNWMKANVGPYAPRILAWWDYGDWINWFGNSNAVIRGDNSVPTQDYKTAAYYVMTPNEGFNATKLGAYMDSIQAKYMLFDNQLVPKWGALDFLACTYVNQTSEQYALQQGRLYGQSFVLGTSGCEIRHDPAYIFIPISQSINSYCQFSSNSTAIALKGIVILGQSPTNITYCVPQQFFSTGNATYLLSANGTRTNAIITTALYQGSTTVQGQQFVSFMLLYAPNGPNSTITNAPSLFYNSTYYRGYFLGHLSGFSLAYPGNFTGINYVNSTHDVLIYQYNNYTGGIPPHTQKPSWAVNNYSVPG